MVDDGLWVGWKEVELKGNVVWGLCVKLDCWTFWLQLTSSEPSRQSTSPSHLQTLAMQTPSLHLNQSSGSQLTSWMQQSPPIAISNWIQMDKNKSRNLTNVPILNVWIQLRIQAQVTSLEVVHWSTCSRLVIWKFTKRGGGSIFNTNLKILISNSSRYFDLCSETI